MASNKDIVETALSLVGKVKYKFGGDNIAGGYGDCSDYTQYVYACYNIDIGGNTETQYSKGISIPRDKMLPGDLILFKNTYNSGYRDGVSHVGIYIGGGKFAHNSSSKGTTVSDFSGYYVDHFLDARRIPGVSYEYESIDFDGAEKSPGTDASGEIENVAGLNWWGDIVRVVIIIIILIAGVALVGTSAGLQMFKGGLKNG